MATTLTLTCIKPGGVRIVDAGRPGFRHLGVPAGGAADRRAQSAANQLLSRDESATCLEFTQTGGRWLLSGQGQFVLTGADMNWRLNGRLVEAHQVQYLEGDGLLTSLPASKGLRSYLAVAGDWNLPLMLGSHEPGLLETTAIQSGWTVDVTAETEAPFQMNLDVDQHYPPAGTHLKTTPGPEWELLPVALQKWLCETPFFVQADSNRQGIRLTAADRPDYKLPELLSTPVLPGTIQLTPSGPILLGPDAQTIGGYPRVLLVNDRDDLAVAFQVPTGETLRFSLTNSVRKKVTS